MRAIITILLTLFLSPTCFSNDLSTAKIDLGMRSYHWNKVDGLEYNETNHDFIGVEYKNLFVSSYVNSGFKRTNSIGYVSDQFCVKDHFVCGDVIVGLATGYQYKTGRDIDFVVAPRLVVELTDKMNLTIFGFPGEVIAVGFQLEF